MPIIKNKMDFWTNFNLIKTMDIKKGVFKNWKIELPWWYKKLGCSICNFITLTLTICRFWVLYPIIIKISNKNYLKNHWIFKRFCGKICVFWNFKPQPVKPQNDRQNPPALATHSHRTQFSQARHWFLWHYTPIKWANWRFGGRTFECCACRCLSKCRLSVCDWVSGLYFGKYFGCQNRQALDFG